MRPHCELAVLTAGERLARAADRRQRRHPWLAFPVAVGKKFSDDHAHNLAALVAYFAFVSIFPLLLVLVTVLDITLRGDAALRHRLLVSALGTFPVIGTELRGSAHPLRETGIALVIGLAGALLGGCGVAAAAQNALNSAWLVPFTARPRFPWKQLRNLAFVMVAGLGLVTTSLLSGAVGGASHLLTGAGARIGAAMVALALNIVLFWAGFRLLTARMISSGELWTGALAGAVAWQVLQLLAGFFATHILARSSSLYGTFGIVLGLLAWLYLQAQITLLAVEIDVVRARGLWPRSLCPPLTPQDMTAYRLYARAEQRRRGIDIEVDDSDAAGPAAASGRQARWTCGRLRIRASTMARPRAWRPGQRSARSQAHVRSGSMALTRAGRSGCQAGTSSPTSRLPPCCRMGQPCAMATAASRLAAVMTM